MKLTQHELLFIHDRARNTLPYMKVIIKRDRGDVYALREHKRLNVLRLKCRKELMERFDVSKEYLDAQR